MEKCAITYLKQRYIEIKFFKNWVQLEVINQIPKISLYYQLSTYAIQFKVTILKKKTPYFFLILAVLLISMICLSPKYFQANAFKVPGINLNSTAVGNQITF